jgi:hypothetical protein
MNRWLTDGPHDLMQQRTLVIGRATFRAATMERLLPIQA